MSIGGILSIARTALFANQAAVQIASHNISNATTEGYSRQRPTLSTLPPVRLREGWIGTGVVIADVNRVRDSFHDVTVRREYANASGFGVRRDLLMQVEGVFGEPSEQGLAAVLDTFWSSWSDLANEPSSSSARSLVRQRGEQVALTLNRFDRSLADLEASTVLRMDAKVGELNTLLAQVAKFNERILSAEVGGVTAGDLRDSRDLAIDRISQIVDVRVLPRTNGSVQLAVGSTTLVDGSDARPVSLSVTRGVDGRVVGAQIVGGTTALTTPGSALGGLIDGLTDIRAAWTSIDDVARTLTQQVNAIHNAPPADRDFFEPGGVTARTIALAADISASAGNVVAGSGGTDNSIALELASLRDLKVPLADALGNPLLDGDGAPVRHSIGGLYRNLVLEVAFKASETDRAVAVAETLVRQAETRRESVSGVSIDEELIQLMRHQQAYAAATKLVNTADEMLQSILNMV
jgi:flagellar hook-associated protein 1